MNNEKSKFSYEEKQWMFKQIIKRLNNEIGDDEWKEFLEFLHYACPKDDSCCKDGVIFERDIDGYEFAYRCNCELGKKHKNLPYLN